MEVTTGSTVAEPVAHDVASPAPVGLVWVLFLGAFSAMIWGLMTLVRGRPVVGPPGPFAAHESEGSIREEVTLEEPGPDR